jgi:hypothetical protein
MRRAHARLFIFLCALALVTSCDRKSPVEPDEDLSFASLNGTTLRLTATAASADRIDLAWQDGAPNETGYELHRSSTGPTGAFTLLTSTPTNITSYSEVSLAAATQYCYRVRAYRTTGRKTTYSGFSNTACATTQNAPPPPPGPTAPSNLNARPAGEQLNTAFLTWQDNSADEEGFRIERASSDQGPWEQVIVRAGNSMSHYDFNRPLEQQSCYRVIAIRGQTTSASNADCTSFPASPSALVVTAVSAQAVDLAWTDNSAHEDGFAIERSEENEWGPFTSVGTTGVNVTTFHDGSVSANKTYWYRVGTTREGARTGVTAAVRVIIAADAPAAPSSVNAIPSGSVGIAVYWPDASGNEAGFRVERSDNGGATWVAAGSTPPNTSGFFDGGRTSDQQMCYRVFAFNAVGDSPSSPVDCTAPPAGPTNLVATTASDLAIDLTWTDNSSVEDGYEVKRFVRECSGYYYYYCNEYYATIATLEPNARSYRDRGLARAVEHTYIVVAVKDGGVSDESNVASAWSNQPPPAATNLTAAAISGTQIDLAWSDNSTDEENFVVSRCTGTDAACGDGGFSVAFWVGANVTTYSDMSAQPNTTYTYRVYTYNGHFSPPSSRASATTLP